MSMQSLPEETELDCLEDDMGTLRSNVAIYKCDCALQALNTDEHLGVASKLRLLLRVIHSLKTNPDFDGNLPTLLMTNFPLLAFVQHELPTVPQLVLPDCWTGTHRNHTVVLESFYPTGDNLLITVPLGQPVTYLRI